MIENALIEKVDLSMADHGVLCLEMVLKGQTWGVVFGGRVMGKGYLGAKKFEGYAKGIEEIMRIMDVVGVSKFNDMEGKYVRVETERWVGGTVHKIGNIIEDKWFDYDEFYKKELERSGDDY